MLKTPGLSHGSAWPAVYALLLVFLGVGLACAEEPLPKVITKFNSNERTIAIQLQQVAGPIDHYRVEIVDLIDGGTVATIGEFTGTPLKHVFEALWPLKEGHEILAARVVEVSKAKRLPGELEQTPGHLGQIEFKGEFVAVEASLKFEDSLLSWDLGRPVLARAMVATRSGLPLSTPLDWGVLTSGKGSASWNFRGEDGFDYSGNPYLVPYLQTIPLPGHWVVVGNVSWQRLKDRPQFKGLTLPDEKISFDLKAVLPSGEMRAIDEKTKYEKGMAIRFELGEASRKFMSGKRFEILIYFNGDFVHEESQGVSPYLYVLPQNLNGSGREIISVNVLEYGGSWGTQSFYLNFTADQ